MSSETQSIFELRRKVPGDTSWKTIQKGVVDFGVQSNFLYASLYKDKDPNFVRIFPSIPLYRTSFAPNHCTHFFPPLIVQTIKIADFVYLGKC